MSTRARSPIKEVFTIPVDERAARALQKMLSKIKHENGYNVNFEVVRRYRASQQLPAISTPAEIHIICGHVYRGSEAVEILARRSSADQWWSEVPFSILFFLMSTDLDPEISYRVAKADILKCLFSNDVVDENGFVYPIQIGPSVAADGEFSFIRSYPLYSNDKPEYAAGVIELNLLATFSADDPYIVGEGDSYVRVSKK